MAKSDLRAKTRQLSPSDLPELVSAIRSSLNLDDNLSTELIKFRIFDDPDFDPRLNLVALSRGKIVSFISAVQPVNFPPKTGSGKSVRQRKAWIKLFFTLKKYRKRGLAGQLYSQVIEELKTRGVKEIRFSDIANWHFWPGIDLRYEDGLDFLLNRGFEKVEEVVDYDYDLSKFYYPRRVQRLKRELRDQGVETGMATAADEEELTEWIGSHFSPYWKSETKFAFLKSKPIVAMARDGRGKILGFATCNAAAPGKFGPAGVDRQGRGKGIGTVLLFDAFQAMKNARQSDVTVHWTDHLFYYTQVPGLCGVRHYWVMRVLLG